MRTLILAGLGAGIWLAGCASSPDTFVDGRSAAIDRTCGLVSASRIERNDEDCGAPGRSYTQDDLRRTGALSTSEALQRLDPSITVAR